MADLKSTFLTLIPFSSRISFMTLPLNSPMNFVSGLNWFKLLKQGNDFNEQEVFLCLSFEVACALIIAGENLKNHVDVKNVLVDIGIYFQVQENYGKSDQSNAAIVKDLFKELDLEV
ncbi:hypothetical protein ARALYDRAFT_905124 [Arabidopsis lyrata subsp. lyrata]|uniref:Uncharacterized protein n=1 Tax=Arabidopsis lyrata subsp. lyrata TaxID=81972 RepID=D7LPV4_ARALL|nr:hypothetical protein ARALYDRAFT_905124 [Arabidopsis lyrata subsp. lyrata]